MPIPLPSMTFSCTRCDWKRTVAGPVSDCRVSGLNHFRGCPQCDCEVVERLANPWEMVIARWEQARQRLR